MSHDADRSGVICSDELPAAFKAAGKTKSVCVCVFSSDVAGNIFFFFHF